MTAKQRIKDRARELGFDLIGFARIADDHPIDPQNHLTAWLKNGYHGEMAYMADAVAERQNPTRVLQHARTAIVLARRYLTEAAWQRAQQQTPHGYGRVALYAAGRDYHRIMTRAQRKLAKFIRDNFTTSEGTRAQTYAEVDTGPVLERAWAARAGLGFIGKNTLLIAKGQGSYLALAVIFTTLALEPDEPVTRNPYDACGSCRLCLDACPTSAFPEPFILDASKCIAYLTIEKRSALTDAEAAALGDHLFGCDECQTVCPYNAKPRFDPTQQFAPRFELPLMRLEPILELDDEAFDIIFEGSAMRRARRDGLQRTARLLLTRPR